MRSLWVNIAAVSQTVLLRALSRVLLIKQRQRVARASHVPKRRRPHARDQNEASAPTQQPEQKLRACVCVLLRDSALAYATSAQ